MKRVHPEDQENLYPGSRGAGLPTAPFRHHFDRVADVTRPPFSAAHLVAGPG